MKGKRKHEEKDNQYSVGGKSDGGKYGRPVRNAGEGRIGIYL